MLLAGQDFSGFFDPLGLAVSGMGGGASISVSYVPRSKAW